MVAGGSAGGGLAAGTALLLGIGTLRAEEALRM
jgi:hypothetical protein